MIGEQKHLAGKGKKEKGRRKEAGTGARGTARGVQNHRAGRGKEAQEAGEEPGEAEEMNTGAHEGEKEKVVEERKQEFHQKVGQKV